jgi:hypothetical protein
MRRASSVLTYVLVVVTVLAAPLAYSSERSTGITSQAELESAVAKSLDREDAARDSIRTLLHRDDVRVLAAANGLDVRKAEAAVATLDGAELQSVSAQAAQIDSQLAGGDPAISLSLVSLLLIIIIIILLVK